MERPTGVTVLAVLMIICAVFLAIGALAFLFMGAAIQARGMSSGMAMMMAGLGAAGAAILLGLAVLYVILAIGLLKLANWARVATIVLIALGLVFAAMGLFSSLVHFAIGLVLWQLFWCAIDVWIILYLLKPHVKQAFSAAAA